MPKMLEYPVEGTAGLEPKIFEDPSEEGAGLEPKIFEDPSEGGAGLVPKMLEEPLDKADTGLAAAANGLDTCRGSRYYQVTELGGCGRGCRSCGREAKDRLPRLFNGRRGIHVFVLSLGSSWLFGGVGQSETETTSKHGAAGTILRPLSLSVAVVVSALKVVPSTKGEEPKAPDPVSFFAGAGNGSITVP